MVLLDDDQGGTPVTLREVRRALRGPGRAAVDDLASTLPDPIRIETPDGRVLYGEGEGRFSHPIQVDGEAVALVHGGPGSDAVARLLGLLTEQERQRRALADETLGRYKELTLLYDMSDKLSRVLEVDEVADLIVREAQRFLGADGAALMLLDLRARTLRSLAQVGEHGGDAPSLSAGGSIEARVIETGNAEVIEDVTALDLPVPVAEGVRSVMCAPLRTGEKVVGVLRLTSASQARWSAGDLKLLRAMAANSAAAVSRALLHRDQQRQQLLRRQIERFVSPELIRAALDGPGRGDDQGVAVLFCDLAGVTEGMDTRTTAEGVLARIEGAACAAMRVLLQRGAIVNLARGELLVALFPDRDGFAASAGAAAKAAVAVARSLEGDLDTPTSPGPGIGLARARIGSGGADGVVIGIGRAATLQAAAEGRILVDAAVEAAIRPQVPCVAAETLDIDHETTEVHEIVGPAW